MIIQAPNEAIKTVKDALSIYGVEDMDLFQYLIKADMISIEVFDDDVE